jgi:uncharacterized protein YkwD
MAQEHPSDFGEIFTLRTPRSNRRRILALLSALPLTLALAVSRELDQPLASVADAKKKRKKRRRGRQKKISINYSTDSEERAFLTLINNYRRQNGRKELALQDQLGAAAQFHSEDQARHTFSSHKGSNGSSVSSRIRAANYRYSYYGENIYWNNPDGSARAAFDWWKSSPGHNANMLNENFTQIGIARAQSESGTWYWTTDFGQPM